MRPHDLMYEFYIVSLHTHNNKHAQNFFFSYLGPYSLNSFLFSRVNLDLYHSHSLLRLFHVLKLFQSVGSDVFKYYNTVGVHRSFPQGVIS